MAQCITIVRLFLGQQEKKYQKLLLNQSVYSKTVHPRKILFTESRGSSRFCNNKVVSDFEFGDFLSKGRTNFNCVFWYIFSRWPKNKRTILIKQVKHCVVVVIVARFSWIFFKKQNFQTMRSSSVSCQLLVISQQSSVVSHQLLVVISSCQSSVHSCQSTLVVSQH